MKRTFRLIQCLYFLLLQSERYLDTIHLLDKRLIYLQPLLYGRTAMDNRRMVSTANEFAYSGTWYLCVLLCQIHRHLSCLHIFAFTTLTEDILLGDIEMLAE